MTWGSVSSSSAVWTGAHTPSTSSMMGFHSSSVFEAKMSSRMVVHSTQFCRGPRVHEAWVVG